MTPDRTSEYDVTVKYQRAWQEWRPECTCGWIGSYWPQGRDSATREGARHLLKAHGSYAGGRHGD